MDLECTHLKGNFGHLLCGSLLDYHTGRVLTRQLRPWIGRRINDDHKLALRIREDWEAYDIWVSWNGKMFDVPYLNTRLQRWGERPLIKRKHIDLMYYARRPHLTLHSSRLDAVAKFLRSPHQKTPLDPAVWVEAMAGSRSAVRQVVEHCEADVRVLRDVYECLKPHVATIHR